MNRIPFRALWLGVLVLQGATAVRADEEADLLAVLRSDAAIPAKAEACKRLRTVGTVQAVPVLAQLLTQDERLGQAARYALEGLPAPEAVTALRVAATRSSGNLRLGLFDSLGWRRDAESVPMLAEALIGVDRGVAASAATALGRIGTDPALEALRSVRSRVLVEVGRSVREALLRCAEVRVAGANRAVAEAIYRSLYVPEEEENIRQAAYAGLIRSAATGASSWIVSGLESADPAAQAAAFRVAGEVQDPELTRALSALMARSTPAVQIRLLALVRRRGDTAAAGAVKDALASSDAVVRLAAIQAVALLGDAGCVPALVNAATATDPLQQAAAREALEVLPRGDVTAALVAQVGTGGVVEREVFRALRARQEPAAISPVLELCRSDRPATRGLALNTLGGLARPSDLGALVALVLEAKNDEARSEIYGVFETLVERMGEGAVFEVQPLVHGLADGSGAERKALLPAAVLFVDERLRVGLRAALTDTDASVRLAAARALGEAGRDAGLIPDLLASGRQASEAGLRSAAVLGVVRLATQESVTLAPRARAEALIAALDVARSPGDRSSVVIGLGQVMDGAALDAVEKAGAEAALREDAERAGLRIAQALGAAEFDRIEPVLTRLGQSAVNPAVRSNALAVLRRLDSGWLSAGPYREAGRQAEALFDIVFPAERPGAAGIEWRRAPGSADPAHAGEIDLGGVTGGDQCVIYLKTRVYAPAAQDVALAIGSDDGIKLWVNGELVHANNAVRGLTPGQDRARARLREGWNDFLAKITQSTAGCGLSLRITTPGGAEIPGLRIDSKGDASGAASGAR